MDDALQALQEWKVYDQSASARTAGELEQWFDYYSNTNIPWLIPGSDREYINDELDEAKIDRQVVATAKGCSVSDELCLCCTSILSTVHQELSLHRPDPWNTVEPTDIESDSEWISSEVSQDHDSKSIEAGSKSGCRLCVLLLRSLKNDRVLKALRSIEDRLERLDKPNDSYKATQSPARCTLLAEVTINWATPFALRFYCPQAMHGAKSSHPIITLDVWGQRGWYKAVKHAIDLPQFWSRYCMLYHLNCRHTAQTQVASPTRLLSISEDAVRLIHTSGWAEPLPYATLSHCWGDTKFLCLNSANLHTLASGIHWDDLANTFKDAIEIARRARLNYIWIDSLCIVQDSRSDWQLESAKMGMIYRGSSLNIAAASATDGTQGCLPRKPSSRSISTFRTAHADDDTLLRNTWASESYDLHRNHLETRAWCMQELILAPRTLYCTNKGLFWECKSRLATEDLQTLDQLLPALPDVRAITTVESWMRRIVVPYSKCSLTFSTDKLPALDGLARIIQPNIGSDYLAGLWRSHMVLQLCWFAKRSETRPPYRGAPSWSWASVDGPVDLYPRLDQQDIKPAESSFVTLVHDVVTEMAHSNAFGELKMGRLRINCSKLVVGCYQFEEQHDAHQILVCDFGRASAIPSDEAMPYETFQFRPDSIPNIYSEVASAEAAPAICESGAQLAMLPLKSMVALDSLQDNGKDWIHDKSTFGLVLKPLASRPGEYTRVGSFECAESHGVGYKFLHESDDSVRFARILGSSGAGMARAACARVLKEPAHKSARYQLEIV